MIGIDKAVIGIDKAVIGIDKAVIGVNWPMKVLSAYIEDLT